MNKKEDLLISKEKESTKRDHREVSKELEMYFFDQKSGQGLPFLLPQWVEIRNQIDKFLKEKQKEYNFKEVVTPILGNRKLYETSGHLSHYEENMFPEINKNGETFILRPMTCPHHCLVYLHKPHSYKELPIRLCENSIIHRYEPSGSLKGLERVRWMELSDHHIFLNQENLKEEFKKNYKYISEVIEKFDLKISRLSCSISDPENKEKYHSDKGLWKYSENLLSESLKELNLDFVTIKGEAAFYGPKLDIEVETIDGKNVTLATIQIDLVTPKKFGLKYIDKNKELKEPVMIHHSPVGTYQRFIALLLEQTNGRLPFWISPCQMKILPINDEGNILSLCKKISEDLNKSGIRNKISEKRSLGFRIKELYKEKIPYYLVVGKEELEKNKFKLKNSYLNSEENELELSEIVEKLSKKIK